jgi:D-glycero-D-manno-heptose 1,7-bisphosphate phosphatase
MTTVIERHGGRVEAVMVCPHRPDEDCECRKPKPGLLYRARDEYGIRLQDAVLIGDHHTDVEAAQRAGCASILVLSGRVQSSSPVALPPGCLAVLPDLLAAVHYLVDGAVQEAPERVLVGSWTKTNLVAGARGGA